MKRKPLLILLLLIIFFNQCLSQNKYTISKINSENGLPQNTIKDLHFDNAGYLWIATENGLMRYDGNAFKIFSSHTDTPINNRIIRLNCNPENNLYAIDANGTMAEISKGRLYVVHKGSFNHPLYPVISLGSQLPSFLFRKLDPAGALYKKENASIENFIPLDLNKYVVLYNNSIDLYKETKLEETFPFPSAKKHEIFTINNQVFALDYSSGFYLLDFNKSQWSKVLNETGFNSLNAVDVIWEHHHKLPFAVYNDKLYRLDFKSGKLISSLVIDSLGLHSTISSVEEDSVTRQYFIGTETEGLFIYRKKLFQMLSGEGKKRTYYGQYPLNDNYILTNTGDIIGQGPGKPNKAPIPRFNNYVISDSANNLFYASGDSVFKYSVADSKSHLLFVNRQSEMYALNLAKDTLWMINNNGIFYHVKGKNYTSLLFTSNLNNLTYVVEKYSPGKLLFGNCMGLFSYQPSIKRVDTILFYPQRCVRSVWKYNDKYFIGTYGEGWKIWRGNKIYNMPTDSKGYLLYSHCFIRDESNFLWIPTNHGIFKYYLPDIENYINGKTTSLFNYYYSTADGVENPEFNGGCYPCYLELRNGYYSVPNISGLVWFKPAESETVYSSNGIYIDKIEVNNLLFTRDNKPLVFPTKTSLLRIEISSPFFGEQVNFPMEFRTIGVDTTWKLLNLFTSAIRYTTLPAGVYQLQIRKPLGFGRGYSITSLTFKIKPAWYSTPVALAGWIILLLLIIMLVIRARTLQYKRREIELQKMVNNKVIEVREANIKLSQNIEVLQKYQQELIKKDLTQGRFIKIISHDIIGPLRFLAMVTSQIEKQKESIDKQYLLDSLVEMKQTSENLLALSVDLLNWINYQKENVHITCERFDLNPLLGEKLDMFRKMAASKSVKLSYECPSPFYIYNDVNIIKIIVRNLLSNAIKFTHDGTVTISSGLEDHVYYIKASDTGKGMTEAQVNNLKSGEFVQPTNDTENKKGYGIGFMIIRELVAITNGTIEIDSKVGQGTTISIKWPLEVKKINHHHQIVDPALTQNEQASSLNN